MLYVYLLRSESDATKRYTGITSDIDRRLKEHNQGKSVYTAKYMPWRLVTYLAFSDDDDARSFEGYLKTGSGQAFANKRLWDKESSA